MKATNESRVYRIMRWLILATLMACSKQPEASSVGPSPSQITSTSTAMTVAATDDVGGLLQKTLDLRELQTFWHLEQKARGPLHVLFAPPLTERYALEKFGMPIVWIDATSARPRELVEITKIDVRADVARVEFRIRDEGVFGHAAFAKRGPRWELVDSKVAER